MNLNIVGLLDDYGVIVKVHTFSLLGLFGLRARLNLSLNMFLSIIKIHNIGHITEKLLKTIYIITI